MKLPNSYGSVYKLSGNRRKPYAVRKTVGWKKISEDKKAQPIYEFIGYYRTKSEALQALADYNANPYEVKENQITFSELYDLWSAEHFAKVSHSNINGVKAAYKLCDSIKNKRIVDIRLADLQKVVDESGKNYPTLRKLKVVFGLMYKYGVIHELVPQEKESLVAYIDISKAGNPNKTDRNPFTKADIKRLWEISDDDEYASVVLMLIYSGCRISELLDLKKEDVFLDEKYFKIIVSKTQSGIRAVPISDKTMKFFEKWYNKNDCEYLLSDLHGSHFAYSTYYDNYWKPLMKEHNFNGYTPHCTRHTCISLLTAAGVDERLIQKIVGHKGETVTRAVYTHLEIETLLSAINLI